MLNTRNNVAEPSSSIKCGEFIASPSEPLASPAGQLVRACVLLSSELIF
jgi:hypothetical protein